MENCKNRSQKLNLKKRSIFTGHPVKNMRWRCIILISVTGDILLAKGVPKVHHQNKLFSRKNGKREMILQIEKRKRKLGCNHRKQKMELEIGKKKMSSYASRAYLRFHFCFKLLSHVLKVTVFSNTRICYT